MSMAPKSSPTIHSSSTIGGSHETRQTALPLRGDPDPHFDFLSHAVPSLGRMINTTQAAVVHPMSLNCTDGMSLESYSCWPWYGEHLPLFWKGEEMYLPCSCAACVDLAETASTAIPAPVPFAALVWNFQSLRLSTITQYHSYVPTAMWPPQGRLKPILWVNFPNTQMLGMTNCVHAWASLSGGVRIQTRQSLGRSSPRPSVAIFPEWIPKALPWSTCEFLVVKITLEIHSKASSIIWGLSLTQPLQMGDWQPSIWISTILGALQSHRKSLMQL